ncbi:MAG: hypothetical protein IPO15_09580 [Anaerolineae bacterium]|uniref:hypothetical protein n=1 Tax=Candidatus Amarolinea dominans TaxID=3140696 RepID=UPI003135FAB9|nr:hypothetical protein [Anaerolineae bacterium]
MRLPSGLYAADQTPAVWPTSIFNGARSLARQTRTVPSSPAETIVLPSGLKWALLTAP